LIEQQSKLVGMPGQIEWAEQIKPRVGAEFDRVANVLRAAASNSGSQVQHHAEAVIAIIEEKRAEVMAIDQAGYFIVEWQELTDQVRRMLARDPRYQALQAKKPSGKLDTNE
jgi:hypothetical protein